MVANIANISFIGRHTQSYTKLFLLYKKYRTPSYSNQFILGNSQQKGALRLNTFKYKCKQKLPKNKQTTPRTKLILTCMRLQ